MSAKWVREYFSFSQKERLGIIVLLLIMTLVWFLPEIFPKTQTIDQKTLEDLQKETNRFFSNDSGFLADDTPGAEGEYVPVNPQPAVMAREFYFDPNTLSLEGWRKLGLKERTIQTILNYLAHGGKFRKAVDLEKIYGLQRKDLDRLRPYVRIEPEKPRDEKIERDSSSREQKIFHKAIAYPRLRKYSVDINHSDTSEWIALPGIGSRLALRIVNFREKLGGFYSVHQVAETFALPDSTYHSIQIWLHCNPADIRTIELNSATIDQLKSHPYIRYALANAIIQFRLQHGPFKTIEDLRKISLVTDEVFTKIKPYLTVN